MANEFRVNFHGREMAESEFVAFDVEKIVKEHFLMNMLQQLNQDNALEATNIVRLCAQNGFARVFRFCLESYASTGLEFIFEGQPYKRFLYEDKQTELFTIALLKHAISAKQFEVLQELVKFDRIQSELELHKHADRTCASDKALSVLFATLKQGDDDIIKLFKSKFFR